MNGDGKFLLNINIPPVKHELKFTQQNTLGMIKF